MAKLSVEDLDLSGKRVLMRVDFNVPLDKKTGKITDDTRIVASLKTIKYCLDKGAKLILMSHLGRPDGKVVPSMSLKPVAERLGEFIGKKIIMASDCIGIDVEKASQSLKTGDVLLLENLRFHAEEEDNDENFSKQLASLGDVYVNDAFGTAHRAHASTAGVTKYLKSAAGFLLKKEIDVLGGALNNPEKPFVAILGGAKVSSKIGVIQNLLPKVSSLLIGGAMAYTFLEAMGEKTGNSLVEKDKVQLAKDLLAADKEKKIMIPVDHIAATEISSTAKIEITPGRSIPDGFIGVDIGPKTLAEYKNIISKAALVLWNGPMGVFETDAFAKGTIEIAKLLAQAKAKTVVGGGDSVAALAKAGVTDKIFHVSTGGGASLEFLEGITLPGVAALTDK